MKITLTGGKPAADSDVRSLESLLACAVSEPFLQFVERFDGARSSPNIFNIGTDNQSGVNEFIPVAHILDERAVIGDLPDGAYPIAVAEGGNYVFIDEGQEGAVFFWDHEIEGGVTRLASNFDDFLNSLEPFDVDSIELEPGQVEKVWIDPDFLKKIKQYEK